MQHDDGQDRGPRHSPRQDLPGEIPLDMFEVMGAEPGPARAEPECPASEDPAGSAGGRVEPEPADAMELVPADDDEDAFGGPSERVPLADIVPCRWLQRVRDVQDEIAAIRRSIGGIGMIHHPAGRRVLIDGVPRVETLSGHRRIEAARAAGRARIWMRVCEMDDADAFRTFIDGNLGGGSGSVWEDARYIRLWRRLFAAEGQELATQAAAAEFFGYSEPRVSLALKFLSAITPDVWEAAGTTEAEVALLGWKDLTTIAAVRRFEDRVEQLRQAIARMNGAVDHPRRARRLKPPIILRESATGRVVLEVDFGALDDPDVAREALRVTEELERRVHERLREPA